MRASLVSATSLLALLIAEEGPALAAPVLSDASSTISSGSTVAGSSASSLGVSSASVAGASGTQITIDMPASPFSFTTSQPNAALSDTGTIPKTFIFGALTGGAASTTMIAAGHNSSDLVVQPLPGTGAAPAFSSASNRSFSLLAGSSAANMGNGNLMPGMGRNRAGTTELTSSVFTGTGKPFSFNGSGAERVSNTVATATASYTYTQAARGGADPAVARTAPANGAGAGLQGGAAMLKGTGAASVQSPMSAANNTVRAGTAPVSMLTVSNTGNGRTSEPGAAGNPRGPVEGLSAGRTSGTQNPTTISPVEAPANILGYTYNPGGRGMPTSTVTFDAVNGSHAAQAVSKVFTNQLVEAASASEATAAPASDTSGPSAGDPVSPASSKAGFSTLGYTQSASIYPAIKTISSDASDSQATEQFSIAAADPGYFSLPNIAASSPASGSAQVLLPLATTNAQGTGMLSSSLMVFSDSLASLGGTAGMFTFALTNSPMPEPATLAVLGVGLTGLLSARRRRR